MPSILENILQRRTKFALSPLSLSSIGISGCTPYKDEPEQGNALDQAKGKLDTRSRCNTLLSDVHFPACAKALRRETLKKSNTVPGAGRDECQNDIFIVFVDLLFYPRRPVFVSAGNSSSLRSYSACTESSAASFGAYTQLVRYSVYWKKLPFDGWVGAVSQLSARLTPITVPIGDRSQRAQAARAVRYEASD